MSCFDVHDALEEKTFPIYGNASTDKSIANHAGIHHPFGKVIF
jgi:hypothetical protein